MNGDHEFSCRCGAFRARVARGGPSGANRVICYCESCQKFARELGAEATLVEGGGSDIVQISSARIDILDGSESLAALKLSDKGPVRWHTTCCNTPIGAAAGSARIPFIGLNNEVAKLPEAMTGPVTAQLYRRSATKRVPEVGQGKGMFAVILGFARVMIPAMLRGDGARSPFYGPNRKPIVRVRRIEP